MHPLDQIGFVQIVDRRRSAITCPVRSGVGQANGNCQPPYWCPEVHQPPLLTSPCIGRAALRKWERCALPRIQETKTVLHGRRNNRQLPSRVQPFEASCTDLVRSSYIAIPHNLAKASRLAIVSRTHLLRAMPWTVDNIVENAPNRCVGGVSISPPAVRS